ncbi:hypothetical protein [Nocardioides speluncae]|uniref:hypothetical protein n=1 Tax=Nocardioides speluncae TaxID=2670337 RepID=UPI000D69A911|nr:hypothetical protein [Nocardioides speluncae]
MPTACERLADTADAIVADDSGISGEDFLLELGERAAGIRRGLSGLIDLVSGGSNPIEGGGFKKEYGDGSGKQVRHFAGMAAAAARLGTDVSSWTGEHIRRDPDDSADGRLNEAAIRFARGLLEGDLSPADAGGWIRANICARAAKLPE